MADEYEGEFGPWRKIDCDDLEISVDGTGFDDRDVVNTVGFVGSEDQPDIIVAIIGLGTPNTYDDKLHDDAMALVSAAPEMLEELEQQADGTATIIALLKGQTSPAIAMLGIMLGMQEMAARAAIAKARGQ